jgi:hypothetical protein
MEFGNQSVTGNEATRMRCSHPASFHQQVNFLRRQFLQDDDLPFTNVPTVETPLRKGAAMGQDGHACMASAETSRNSFSVAPLAA